MPKKSDSPLPEKSQTGLVLPSWTTPSLIQAQIAVLKEGDLRLKVIIPFFKGRGADPVQDRHGNNEKGIDVYFCHEDLFECPHHCGILLKAGDISMSGRKDKDMGLMASRMLQAITNPIPLLSNGEPSEKRIEELYFITNRSISPTAGRFLTETSLSTAAFRGLRFWDGSFLASRLKRFIDEFSPRVNPGFVFSIEGFSGFCDSVIAYTQSRGGKKYG